MFSNISDSKDKAFQLTTNLVHSNTLAYIMFLIALIVAIVNFFVVISSCMIAKKSKQHKGAYMFLGNVSLADTFIGLFVFLSVLLKGTEFNGSICFIKVGAIATPAVVSMYSTAMIAVDRYIYIVHGLYYNQWVTTNRVRVAILVTWIIGLVIGYLPVIIGANQPVPNTCWYTGLMPPKLILTTAMISFLPLTVIVAMHSVILYTTLKHTKILEQTRKMYQKQIFYIDGTNIKYPINKVFNDSANTIIGSRVSVDSNVSIVSERAKKNERSKWKAIKIVTFTMGCVIITMMPFNVCKALYGICLMNNKGSSCDYLKDILSGPASVLAIANCVLNPIVYGWFHPGFVLAFKKLSRQCMNNILNR